MDQIKHLSLNVGGYDIAPPRGLPSGGIGKLEQILQVAMGILFIFAIVFALFNLIRSGIQWATSGGDKEKVEAARKRITFSVIGLLIVLLAFLIINLIGDFFNVKLIGP